MKANNPGKHTRRCCESMLMRLTQYAVNRQRKIDQIKQQIKDKEDLECKQLFDNTDGDKKFKAFIIRNEKFVGKKNEDMCRLKLKKEMKENEEMCYDKKKKLKRSLSEINKNVDLMLNAEYKKKVRLNQIKELQMKKELSECLFKPLINTNTNELAGNYLKRISRNNNHNNKTTNSNNIINTKCSYVSKTKKEITSLHNKQYAIENACDLSYTVNHTHYINDSDINSSTYRNNNNFYFDNMKISSTRKHNTHKHHKQHSISTFSNGYTNQPTPIKLMTKRQLKHLSSSINSDLFSFNF